MSPQPRSPRSIAYAVCLIVACVAFGVFVRSSSNKRENDSTTLPPHLANLTPDDELPNDLAMQSHAHEPPSTLPPLPAHRSREHQLSADDTENVNLTRTPTPILDELKQEERFDTNLLSTQKGKRMASVQEVKQPQHTTQIPTENKIEKDEIPDDECFKDIGLPQSDNQTYSVALCFRPSSCYGAIRIRNSVCSQNIPEIAKENDDILPSPLQLMMEMGADTFRVRLEGDREVIMVDMINKGMCTYEGKFSLSFPDTYVLQACRMFGRYMGQADQPYIMPVHHPVTVIEPDVVTMNCSTPKRAYVEPHLLPVCQSLRAEGRWVESPLADYFVKGNLKKHYHEWYGRQRVQGGRFTKKWGDTMRWEPYHCQFRNYSQDELVEKLAKKQFTFIGDSQTRSLFYPTANAMWVSKILGNPKLDVDNEHADIAVRNDIRLFYMMDNYLSATPVGSSAGPTVFSPTITKEEKPTAVDCMITGMGNWAITGKFRGFGLWSFARYRGEIRRLAGLIKSFKQRTGIRIIWHLMPAFPFASEGYRNNARIKLFNDYAIQVMEDSNVEVFDLFAISNPMLHTSVGYPRGHFNTYHVPEMWAQVLLSFLIDNPQQFVESDGRRTGTLPTNTL